MLKLKSLNGDQSLLNGFIARGGVTIGDLEKAYERLESIDDDIKKWDAIHKVNEIKKLFNQADEETKKIMKIELMELWRVVYDGQN
ncbi:hypothetical protein CJP46_02770 [Paenibacillus sp. XY044]|nr:hypothetical protein CJP46_02770 [Paenibacillus sp. XY044]